MKSHLRSIFTKLNVLSRTEAITSASRRGPALSRIHTVEGSSDHGLAQARSAFPPVRNGLRTLKQPHTLSGLRWQRKLKTLNRDEPKVRAAMTRNVKPTPDDALSSLTLNEAQSPYKAEVWRQLTPRERLRRSWQMRSRLPDLKAAHDRKLFPKP